jgi:acetolactate synthase-1/2/3 large subunit
VLAIGARLGEMTTGGYELLAPPRPAQKLVHLHAGAEELGRVVRGRTCSAVVDGVRRAGAGDARAAGGAALGRLDPRRRRRLRSEPRADAGRAARHGRGGEDARPALFPADTVYTNGAGNFSGWLHRFYRYPGLRHAGRTQLAPTSGAMGYGLPAASPRRCSSRGATSSTSPATATS